ncbi:hypothetical protein R3P38DRAFT_2494212 [Favolaschia claudopus]|uniref:PH domain-containing protein n=1 Tax=Favolaschia claudopus TaxID=2862362 RepID=A0AAW0EC72_9AGAR
MTNKTELFRGDCTAEQAQVWLRTLEGTFTEATKEETKLYKFERSVYPGGAAEKWLTDLPDAEKADFKTLVKAFDKKWPMPKYVARPQTLVINEIKTNKLRLEDVGQVVKDKDGTEVLSHQAWAQRTRKLLADIPNGDPGMLLMEHVRDGLPVAVRKLIPPATALETWEKWLAAVEAIDLHSINDLREEHAISTQNEATFTQIAHALNTTHMLSPGRTPPRAPSTPYAVNAVRHTQTDFRQVNQRPTTPPRYTSFNPSTPQRGPPPHMMTSDNTFGGGSTVRPMNSFTRNLMQFPQSPSAGRGGPASLGGDPAKDAELARCLHDNPRLYPNDQAGIQRYGTDYAAWSNGPRDYKLFPFSPGTAAPGSRECWRCGLRTSPPHGAGHCPASAQIPALEYNVRRFVGQILFPPGQRAGISQIIEVPYDPFGGRDPEQLLYDEEEAGNGEELTV